MDRKSEERSIKRKVYHVMVETLQNMNKHSDEIKHEVGNGLFIVGHKKDVYYIITSNRVKTEKKELLETALDEVNNASREELNQMYKTQIKQGRLTDKGGAGLGLIDIARKTQEKLNYQFLQLNEDEYFFILKVEVSAKKIMSNKEK